MNHGWGHHTDSGMTMIVVVPSDEGLTEGPAVLDAAEAIRELGTILHGSELAFGIRIVVGGVRPAVSLGDAEIGHQESHRFGSHRRAAVGMDAQLAGLDVLLPAGLLDELLGEF